MPNEIVDPAAGAGRHRPSEHGDPIGLPVADWRGAPVPAPVTLTGRHAVAEPLTAGHAAALFAAYADDASGRLWTYMGKGPFADAGSLAAWLEEVCGAPDPLFFHLRRPGGEPIGMAALMRIQPAAGVIEIGHIAIVPAAQRTRAATEALTLMMAHALDGLGYRRLEWKCDALNAASRRAALRFGFRFEGIFLNALVYKGRNRDTAWFAITDAEWPSRRAAIQAWLDDANFDEEGRQRRALRTLREGA